MRDRQGKNRRQGFSLIELVIVVVIIGIIGAIAIPRMSRGAAGASDSALKANLAVLRNALDLYATEHGGKYPTLASLQGESKAVNGLGNALLDYSDDAGNLNDTKTATFVYGPYLRSIPTLGVGDDKVADGFGSADADGVAWIYDEDTGTIKANTDDLKDARDVLYSTY